MSDLTDFLLARIADDKRDAEGLEDDGTYGTWSHWVLAECEAKRQIVALHTSDGGHECPAGFDSPGDSFVDYTRDCHTLRLLAIPDAGHPDYRQEWGAQS